MNLYLFSILVKHKIPMASVLSVGMFLPSGQLKLYRGESFDFFPDRFKAYKKFVSDRHLYKN